MPYKSKAQEAYMHIHHPKIANKWDKEHNTPHNLPEHVSKKVSTSLMTDLVKRAHDTFKHR